MANNYGVHYIYAIRHNTTKKIYVGCSASSKRIASHMSALRNGNHSNKAMQEDCDKYGFKFTVYLLEIIQRGERRFIDPHEREAHWIHYYCTDDPSKGYNSERWYTRTAITKFPKIKDLEELQVQLDEADCV